MDLFLLFIGVVCFIIGLFLIEFNRENKENRREEMKRISERVTKAYEEYWSRRAQELEEE